MGLNRSTRKGPGWDITSQIFVFEDPARIKRTLNAIFGAVLLGSISIAILAYLIPWETALKLSLTSAACFTGIMLIHRRGHPRQASLLALATLTVVSLLGVVTGDGIHDAAIVMLPVIIALGSIVLSRPLFYGLTILILASILTIGTLEYQGVITNKYHGTWIPGDIVILFLITLSCAVIMRLLTLGLNESLVRAHTSEQNYREIFNTSTDAIFIHDAATGEILDVNDRMLEIFGFTRKELDASSFEVIITGDPPFALEDAQRHMKKAVEEGPQVFEWLSRRKGGHRFWCEVALRLTEIGGEDRILAVVRDVDDRKRMEELSKDFPPGLFYDVAFDGAEYVERSIENVQVDIVYGAVLAILVVFVFLRSWRSTFIVSLAIPTSLIATFGFMRLFGFSLNNLTTLALALSVGVVIDDAIVVLENIYRHQEDGESPFTAAMKGTREIALAAMAATFAIAAVFIPVAYMKGMIGQFLFEFGISVAAAVLISLFVALTLTPMLCSRILKVKPTHGRLYDALENAFNGLENADRISRDCRQYDVRFLTDG